MKVVLIFRETGSEYSCKWCYTSGIYNEYLKFLLEHRPGKDMTDEQLAELAPWSEQLQSIKNRM